MVLDNFITRCIYYPSIKKEIHRHVILGTSQLVMYILTYNSIYMLIKCVDVNGYLLLKNYNIHHISKVLCACWIIKEKESWSRYRHYFNEITLHATQFFTNGIAYCLWQCIIQCVLFTTFSQYHLQRVFWKRDTFITYYHFTLISIFWNRQLHSTSGDLYILAVRPERKTDLL